MVVAGNIYDVPNSGGVKRLDTWYYYPEESLTMRINIALIVASQIYINWVEEGQQLQVLARNVQMDYRSLGCTALVIEPVDSTPQL